jgi:hypothetical protein
MPPYDLFKGETQLRAEAGREAPRLIEFLPYVFPPDNFVPFDVVDVQAFVAGSTTVIPIFGNVNSNAVVRWFANEGANIAAVAALRWTILVSGVPYQPYVNMALSRGSIDNPDPIIIRIAPNRIVAVQVVNTDGVNAQTGSTRVKGWFY